MTIKLAIYFATLIILSGCTKSTPTGEITTTETYANFNKTFWNVTDAVRIGSIIRFDTAKDNTRYAVKMSDFIARQIPAQYIYTTVDLDQSIIFSDEKSFEAALKIITPLTSAPIPLTGSQLSGNYHKGKSAKLTFKDVYVQQIDFLPLLLQIQTLDNKQKDQEGAELFSQINNDGKQIRQQHENARFWVVTKVFTPKEIEWSINNGAGSGLNFDCTVATVHCGKLNTASKHQTASSLKGSKTLYVVLKPLFTENNVIRIDNTIQAPHSVNES